LGEKRLRLTIFLLLFFLSLSGIMADLKGGAIMKALPPLEWAAGKLYFLADQAKSKGVKEMENLIQSIKGHFVSAKQLQREIHEKEKLLKKLRRLTRELTTYREAYRENEKLKALLKVKDALKYKTVGAYPVGGSPSPWSNSIIINVGTRDGVDRGSAVLDEQGVVGIVTEAHKEWSKVTLITDPSFSIHVVDSRSGVIGVVKGTGKKWCTLNFVVEDRDVKPGDLLVTSGMAGVYPKGYPVGTVVEIEREPGNLFMEAWVKPKVRFSRLSYLLVVQSRRKNP